MRERRGPLHRILDLKRQAARQADAACLAARRKYIQIEQHVARLRQRVEELNAQFLHTTPGTRSIGRLRAFHDIADALGDQQRQATTEADGAREHFQHAAQECTRIHREIDALNRLLSERHERALREHDKREMRQLDSLILQQQSGKSERRSPDDFPPSMLPLQTCSEQ